MQETEIPCDFDVELLNIPGYILGVELSNSKISMAAYIRRSVKFIRRNDLEEENKHREKQYFKPKGMSPCYMKHLIIAGLCYNVTFVMMKGPKKSILKLRKKKVLNFLIFHFNSQII